MKKFIIILAISVALISFESCHFLHGKINYYPNGVKAYRDSINSLQMHKDSFDSKTGIQ
jgi:hypothetical protein